MVNRTSIHAVNSTGLVLRVCFAMATFFFSLAASVGAQQKPNILVIFGDDIGQTNISIYGKGVVGYTTPNIDRIAKEGMLFTDYYAENSCTAGRSSFITGQTPKRTGLSKVGIPGAPIGLQARDVTIAQALKSLGYERADIVSDQYDDWRVKNAYLMGWMTFHAAEFIETFEQYPPSQTPASFTVDQIEKDVEDKIKAMATTPKTD